MTNQHRLIAAVLAAVTVFAAACSGATPSTEYAPSSEEAESPAPPQAPDVTGLGPVEAGARRVVAAAGFRATVTVDTQGGDRIAGSFDYAYPDRYKLAIGGAIPIDVVWLGELTYVKAGDRWQAAQPTFLPFSPRELLDQVAALSAGEEPWTSAGPSEGCERYQIGSGGSALAETCVAEGEPLRWIRLMDGATTVTVTFADFGQRIDIRIPS